MSDKPNNQGTFRKGGEPPLRAEKPAQPQPQPKPEPKPQPSPKAVPPKK